MPELPFPIVDVHAHFRVVHTIGLHDVREEPRHPALEAYAHERQTRMHEEWGTAPEEPRARTPEADIALVFGGNAARLLNLDLTPRGASA